MMRRAWLVAGAALAIAVGGTAQALAQPGCGPFGFGFANRSFVYGSSRFIGGGWCGPGIGWGHRFGCGPAWPMVGWRSGCFGWTVTPWAGGVWASGFGCMPSSGWWGWPGCGFGGWYGGTSWSGVQSVSLAVPSGGGASFFSGSVVPCPFPVWAPDAVGYRWRAPLLGGVAVRRTPAGANLLRSGVVPSQPALAVAGRQIPRPQPPRPAGIVARKRAAKHVADGDRQLIASGGERSGLSAAAASYRRAALAAADDPDLHIREALVLTWLGRSEDAAAACGRAVALDGRLAGRDQGQVPAVVARGQRIIGELAGGVAFHDARAREAVAALAERWTRGMVAPVSALAAAGASDR
jgi:hypothetical protein